MIDFRYHIVSLTAVLVALALGVVLGAGPLQADIGTTLKGEVTKLRADKDDMRRQLDGEQRAGAARDSFEESLLPTVIDSKLKSTNVAMISLPEADSAEVTSVEQALVTAGAKLSSTSEIREEWALSDATAVKRRFDAAVQLAPLLDQAVPDANTKDDQILAMLGQGLARALTASDATVRARFRSVLVQGKLAVIPASTVRASEVVILGGPIKAADQAEAQQVGRRYAATAVAVAAASSGTVLADDTIQVSADEASPVVQARASFDDSPRLSTVDAPSLPLGQAGIVLSLAEQQAGKRGDYGVGPNVDAAVPASR